MDLLIDAWTFILQHPARFGQALATHITLSLAALATACAIAIPLGIFLADRNRGALVAINLANIGRTLPSLAVLALVMPVMGTGFAPSWFALTLLALPPILINTYTAVHEVDADAIDAARGMGMAAGQIIYKIKLPLALPVLFAGVRTAAVQVVSGAVLAAYIGGGGLGDFITAGIAMMAIPQLLVGAIPATLLSLGTDFLFGSIQRWRTPEGIETKAAA
jgi:osmoprotectant transport system permease protein